MEPKGPADSFGTFLKSTQVWAQNKEGQDPKTKIVTLLHDSGPALVVDLWKESGLSFSEFTDGLKMLSETGLVAMDAAMDAGETVRLTETGWQLADNAM